MNARLPHTLAEAMRPAIDSASILASITLWPWVITLTYRVALQAETRIHIVQSALANRPAGDDLLPADAELLRCDVFPATRFDDMAPAVRLRYRAQYRAFLLWRKARAFGKAELVPGIDYDADEINESVVCWAHGGSA